MIFKTVFITIIVPSAVLGTCILQYSLPHGPLINDCFQYNGVYTALAAHLSVWGSVKGKLCAVLLAFVCIFIFIGILFKAR